MQPGDRVALIAATTFRGRELAAGLLGVVVEASRGGSARVAVAFDGVAGRPVVQWPVEAAAGALRRVDDAGTASEKVVHPAVPLGTFDLDLDL